LKGLTLRRIVSGINVSVSGSGIFKCRAGEQWIPACELLQDIQSLNPN